MDTELLAELRSVTALLFSLINQVDNLPVFDRLPAVVVNAMDDAACELRNYLAI